MESRIIFCTGCGVDVKARLTNGREIYPHCRNLAGLPFWKCDICGNFVGCHHKTKNKTRPLGVIPTPEIKAARQHIHEILDPIWKSGRIDRRTLYRRVAEGLNIREYHTAELRSVEDAREAYRIITLIAQETSHDR